MGKPLKPKIKAKCAYCGKEFETNLSHQKYCSAACAYEQKLKPENRSSSDYLEAIKKREKTSSCMWCGKAIESSTSRKNLFCSEKCRIERANYMKWRRYSKVGIPIDEPAPRKRPKNEYKAVGKTLNELVAEARKHGISYGKLMTKYMTWAM